MMKRLSLYFSVLLLFMLLASCHSKPSSEKYDNHWYGGDVFNLHLVNENLVSISFTPVCGIFFDLKQNGDSSELYFREIDCLLSKGFYSFSFDQIKGSHFATMKVEDDSLKMDYIATSFIEEVEKHYDADFFPVYFKRKSNEVE